MEIIMKIIARGTIASSRDETPFQSRAFPRICVLPSGRWLCGFRAAPSKATMTGQRAMLTFSDDQGATWSEPVEPFIPPPVDGKPGLFRGVAITPLGERRILAVLDWVDHSDPSLPFFNETTEGLLETRIFLAWSEDDGNVWSEPVLMDTAPFDCPTPVTGPVLCLANGDLACQFELNKHYHDPKPWHHSSVLMFSKDGGKTWPEHVLASNDPDNRIFYWDQRPAVLPDGQIVNLFWTFDRKKAVYRNIHARRSDDNGRKWSQMWDTGIPGQPAPSVILPDGRLSVVYVDRTASPLLKMRASKDGGRNWPECTEIVLDRASQGNQTKDKQSMQDAWAEMAAFSLGLPATAITRNGDVLVVYYTGPSTNQTDIKWVRVGAT